MFPQIFIHNVFLLVLATSLENSQNVNRRHCIKVLRNVFGIG